MLFKDERFKFIAELIDAAPIPLAIAGGAVRDEVLGRSIKDFDVLVLEKDYGAALEYFMDQDYYIVESLESNQFYGNSDDFEGRYVQWFALTDDESRVDLLVLGKDKYSDTISSKAFIQAVHLFDNTINMWMYCAGTISFLGGQGYLTADAKQAIQVRSTSSERAEHVAEIAKELGWTYVPLSK